MHAQAHTLTSIHRLRLALSLALALTGTTHLLILSHGSYPPTVLNSEGKMESPTTVPFRLTPTLQHFLTPHGIYGPFAASLAATARCLSDSEQKLEHVLNLIFRDEVCCVCAGADVCVCRVAQRMRGRARACAPVCAHSCMGAHARENASFAFVSALAYICLRITPFTQSVIPFQCSPCQHAHPT